MALKQIDLRAYALTVCEAYEAANTAQTAASLRPRLNVAADELSRRFDQISGRWAEETAPEFLAVESALSSALEALQKPLDKLESAQKALERLKALIGLIDAFLGILL